MTLQSSTVLVEGPLCVILQSTSVYMEGTLCVILQSITIYFLMFTFFIILQNYCRQYASKIQVC